MGNRSTVLVLTAPEDPTADVVITEIHRRGVPVARFDLGAFPLDLRLVATHEGHRWSGRLTSYDASVELDDVCSVYYRRPSQFTFPPEMSTSDRTYAEAEARLGLGGVLAALDCRWVSHPHHVARAEWKPLQLQIAAHCGLRTPPTLISNDPAAAIAFATQVDGPMICKTLSSIVLADHGQHKITYTTLVDPATIDPIAFAATAHLLQPFLPKAFEARVTVVGEQILAVAIEANSPRARIDWRADYDSLRYLPVDVPADIVTGMLAYLDAMGLSYGGFDFVITHDNEWIMLECNPAAQWLWLHHLADLPIPSALANLLTEGTS